MNRKQLGLLLVVCLVLGGAGLMLAKKRQQPYQETEREMGQKLLKDFPINDVAQLHVKAYDGEVSVLRKDDDWVVKERGNYPANFGEVTDLLRKLWEIKILEPVPVAPAQLARLELTAPDKGTNSGTLLEFSDKNGKSIRSLMLGKKHMKQAPSGSPMGGGSWPDGRYVMLGTDPKTVALINDALSNVEPKPDHWLNKDFFKVEKHRSISVVTTNATNNWKLTRETETGEWKLAEAKAGEQLDTSKSSSVTSALNFPSFNDVATNASPEANGLDKPAVTSTIDTFEGYTYTIKVGNKTGEDSYFMQMAVAGNFPKERTPGKDEKPEDKEKLDKEFKEKTKKLEERLKTEQPFAKWTYVVSKWTIDPLLKERKDLLAEKKEEPKKEEAKKDEPKSEEPVKAEVKKDEKPADKKN